MCCKQDRSSSVLEEAIINPLLSDLFSLMLEQKLFMQLIQNVQTKATCEDLHVFLQTRLEFKVLLTIWTKHMSSVGWTIKVSARNLRTKFECLCTKEGILATRET